jgi:hypothetical protein
MSKGILTNHTIGHYGRVGNMFFQVMGLIGIARKQGFDWAVPRLINYDHKERFGSTEDVNIYQHLVHELPEWNGCMYPERHYGWGYHEIQLPHGNQSLTGHFQSDKYFRHAMDEIRHFLKFKDEPDTTTHCAVHIRRGDYDDAYHPLLQQDYYLEAMAQLPLGTKFKIFSDDIEAAIRMLGINQNFEYITGNDYITDFKIMKSCHSFICANSSFSLAAAVLSNQPGKVVVCPKQWFGQAWGGGYQDMARDVYPQGAVIV